MKPVPEARKQEPIAKAGTEMKVERRNYRKQPVNAQNWKQEKLQSDLRVKADEIDSDPAKGFEGIKNI